MKNTRIKYTVLPLISVLLFGQESVYGRSYSANLDRSQWYLSSSIFECSLVHDIPLYGKGVFYHEAGEELKFFTSTTSNPMQPGKAALVIEGSSWKPGVVVTDLGLVEVVDGPKPITVGEKNATVMINGLLDGMAPAFTRKAWHSDESIRVLLNSINFRSVYGGYQECVAGLLPVNFRQVEKSRVHFEVDKAKLTDNDKKILDRAILYIKADSSVTAIYVDGHTDNSGRRIYNRILSKERAEAVRLYLTEHGISDEVIRTRYHGERYPVVDNKTSKSKSQNRRTTVRLVRGEVLQPPSDDSPDGSVGYQ